MNNKEQFHELNQTRQHDTRGQQLDLFQPNKPLNTTDEYWFFSDLYQIFGNTAFPINQAMEKTAHEKIIYPYSEKPTTQEKFDFTTSHYDTIQHAYKLDYREFKHATDLKLTRFACWSFLHGSPQTIFGQVYFLSPVLNPDMDFDAMHTIASEYKRINLRHRLSQAEKILSEMPDMLNSRDYLSTMLITDKQKHYEACSDAIENILYFLNNTVSHYCFYDESFSAEYKIDAINKVINIINTVFSDGNFGKLWLNMIYNYGHLARLHFENNDYDNALKNLDICVSFAKKYDNLPEASVRTAQFFENRIYEKTHRSRTMCQRIKYLVTDKYPFSEEFKNSQNCFINF